jgi:putative membrane protein
MKKKLNLNELIWFLILIGFSYYFYMIISTNNIDLYVHPKMVKYVKFALCFFIVLTIFQSKNILSVKKNKSLKLGYIMFIIPLALGIILKAEGLSAYSVINKGFSLTSQLKVNTLKHKHETTEDGTEICELDEQSNHSANNDKDSPENPSDSVAILKNININMTNENFVKIYEDIYGNPHNYDERKITMKGFIYKQEGLKKDEFILSRILVSCCTADAQLVGILCKYNDGKALTQSTWVNIEGTLGKEEYKDAKSGEVSVIPIIKVNNIEKIDDQNNEYIYN